MRVLKSLCLIALLCVAGVSQPATTRPAFDIADVHLSPRSDWSQIQSHWVDGGVLGGDRYELRRASMLDLIKNAYNIDADKVFGGPSWLEYNRYNITAKTKPGTKPAVLKQMLQTLLTDRFHLVLKMETQQIPGFLLTVKGAPKMKRSDGEGAEGCQQLRPTFGGDGPPMANLQCRNMTMEAFAAFLRPGTARVIDSTGLDGSWNFDLQFAGGNNATAGSARGGIFDVLDTLGLKIEPGKIPQTVLTVASVDEQPVPNSPDVATALPSRRAPEFEVASVRPCNDNFSGALRYETGGRVTATCMPVLNLIGQAWKLPTFQNPIGAPKSFQGRTDYSNVSIIAKAPADVAQDRDSLNLMLRALLIDRYRMVTHYEDQPMDTATLIAVKSKLTKADPAGRTACVREFPGGRGGGAKVRLVCRNMTMTQFAEQIQAYDSDLFYPATDGTGIEGAWDFAIDFDPLAGRNFQSFRPVAASTTEGQAPDPSGSISFADALQRQLGLKLEMSKRPQPVLVIDRMEEKPTDN